MRKNHETRIQKAETNFFVEQVDIRVETVNVMQSSGKTFEVFNLNIKI
jgi:hypothetical protein